MENEKPNILFIVIDACRARNLGCYGYNKPTSPNIDRLAKEGVLFENAWACTNFTDVSLTSIFSGKYPISHGITAHGDQIREEHTQKLKRRNIKFLPEILKSKGYTTLAVDWLGRWHVKGYDYYSGTKKLEGGESKNVTLKEIIKPLLNRLPNPLLLLLKRIYGRALPKGHDAKITTDIAINFVKRNQNKKFSFSFITGILTYLTAHPSNFGKDTTTRMIASK